LGRTAVQTPLSPRAGLTPRPSELEGVPLRVSAVPQSFAILSTYPPTACGLATFSAALVRGLRANGVQASVVRVADDTGAATSDVIGELTTGSAASVGASVSLLNEGDVALVQHEYGLYGGTDGDEVLEILDAVVVPSIVVAHTVLRDPTAHQRAVLVDVVARADHVVVMSAAAHQRLCEGFDVDPHKVTTIPHGATVPATQARPNSAERPTLLTCGLVGPGKGIERVIDAMTSLQTLSVRPRYLVAGRTHPKVLAADGEAYRNARIEQSWRNGVAASVSFDASYRDVPALTNLIQSATAVVLPYDSKEQVTSGVLVDAVAAGRPIIATAFPHAVELLASGAGIVVDHDDPEALASALARVVANPSVAETMAAEAARLAPTLGWPVVARAYIELAGHLIVQRAVLV
jgi:glycosyltransferase involved in cell wall biosynthesis